MKSSTTTALSQLHRDDLNPVPPPGRTRGLNVHAVKLIRLTHADQRTQRAMQISYRRYPALPSGAGRKQDYADWSILLLSLIQALWHLSQEQVVGWAMSWPALADACGFQGTVISASQYSRRLRRLGLFPYFVFFVSLVMELVTLGVIRGDDLIIDSTFLRAWSLKDTAAGWYYRAGQKAERFGFKVHTILCRWSTLPVLFVVTPANWHDSVVAIPLFRAVKALYGFAIRIVRADAAYWNYAFLGFIALQRQVFNAVSKIFGGGGFGDQFQVTDANSNGHAELMGINDASEWNSVSLTGRGFSQEIFILRKQHTLQFSGTIQQNVIRHVAPAILLSRQNIHASQAQTSRDRSMDVLVHVQHDAHGKSPCVRSLAARGDGPAFRRASSAYCQRRSMSASSSSL